MHLFLACCCRNKCACYLILCFLCSTITHVTNILSCCVEQMFLTFSYSAASHKYTSACIMCISGITFPVLPCPTTVDEFVDYVLALHLRWTNDVSKTGKLKIHMPVYNLRITYMYIYIHCIRMHSIKDNISQTDIFNTTDLLQATL